MKTLDEIINRQDYVRANKALAERVRELAPIFANKIYELTDSAWRDRTERPAFAVSVNGHSYCVIVVRTIGSIIDEVTLARVYDSTYRAGWEYFFNYDDLRYTSKHSVLLDFLNDAKDILAKLDEAESELVKESEAALENAKNIEQQNI
jgi:hypothetical protein